MIEMEIKILITEEEYNQILLNNHVKIFNEVIQENYYFDTTDFFYDKNGITVRIRKIQNRKVLMVKVVKPRLNSEVRHSEEFELILTEKQFQHLIKGKLNIKNFFSEFLNVQHKLPEQDLQYLGNLCTNRKKIVVDGLKNMVELDFSKYLNKKDWEIEYEIDNQNEINLFSNWLKSMGISKKIEHRGKYGRFIDQLKVSNQMM